VHACRRSSIILIACLSYAFTLLASFACGRAGHQIVARVAERGLNPAVAGESSAFLGGKSREDVAPLPDTWRSKKPQNPGDCPSQERVGRRCAVAAIEHSWTMVADWTTSNADRGRALTFLVPFVGDIHQLRCADNHDRRSINVAVIRPGAATHRLRTSSLRNLYAHGAATSRLLGAGL